VYASRIAEESKWKKEHTLLFLAFSTGTAIEAYVYSLPYIAETWTPFPRTITLLLSVWSPLWLLLGGLLVGPLSDVLGRKKTFYVTMILYVIGGSLLVLASSYQAILASLSMLLFSAGGEYQSILVATHELMPRRNRSASIFLVVNFTNLGGTVAAILSMADYTSPHTQRIVLGATLLFAVAAIFTVRTRTPESIMWLEARGKSAQAKRELEKYYGKSSNPSQKDTPIGVTDVPLWFRVLTGSVLGWSYTAGFSLVVLALGPYFFPKLTDEFIVVAGVTAFLSGLVGLVADSLSRKGVLLASSVATFATASILLPTQAVWLVHPQLFWLIFISLSAFVNVFFLAEDALKSEFWPTERRGLYTATVRTASLGGSIPVLLYASTLPITQYFYLGLTVFAAGVTASAAWYRYGVETGKKRSANIWANTKHAA
jgi:MFS family permease